MRSEVRLRPLLAALSLVPALVSACSVASDPGASGDTANWQPTSSSSEASTHNGTETGSGEASTVGSDESSGSSDTSESTSTGPLLDVGGGTGKPPAMGCEKVDLLFVIDNSGSMAPVQDALIASFPGFVDTINAVAEVSDLHVMVTDTDAGQDPYILCAGDTCNCAPAPDCCNQVCSYFGANSTCMREPACAGYPEAPPPDACDDVLGAGKDESKLRYPCDVEGDRFLAGDDPNLGEKFACIAEVGTNGSAAHAPGQAATVALTDLQLAGQCNENFLRDDAILVLVVVANQPDETSTGTPAQWFDTTVEAKNGDTSSIVTLGLLNDPAAPGAPCGWVESAPRMIEWLTAFEHHQLASVCEPDFTSFFDTSVGLIDQICDEFVPPG